VKIFWHRFRSKQGKSRIKLNSGTQEFANFFAQGCKCICKMAVMCPSHFCRVRVTSPSSQSYIKFFRVELDSSHDLVESSHFQSLVCKQESISSHMKFHIFSMTFVCYVMTPDKLENCAQCCFNPSDWGLFLSKFSQLAFYLSRLLSV